MTRAGPGWQERGGHIILYYIKLDYIIIIIIIRITITITIIILVIVFGGRALLDQAMTRDGDCFNLRCPGS